MTSILTIIQQQDDEYDRVHADYESGQQRIENATTPEELEAATVAFHPIQQAFLRNREQAMPTELYQIIASYLDRLSRTRLAECDKHLHHQVIYGLYSGRFVWSVGEQLHRPYERAGMTAVPLIHACRDGSVPAIRALVMAKADVSVVGYGDWTPLHFACNKGLIDAVDVLIDAGADVNALAEHHTYTPLSFAMRSVDIVRRLIQARANVNIGGSNTPLSMATQKNAADIARVLIEEAQADVNYVDTDGHTALHVAVTYEASQVLPILLSAGADVNLMDYDGYTPLALECWRNNQRNITTLLAANANPNIVDNEGKSPLMFVCDEGFSNIVSLLLSANADVNLIANNGATALQLAQRRKHDHIIAMLLNAGAHID